MLSNRNEIIQRCLGNMESLIRYLIGYMDGTINDNENFTESFSRQITEIEANLANPIMREAVVFPSDIFSCLSEYIINQYASDKKNQNKEAIKTTQRL